MKRRKFIYTLSGASIIPLTGCSQFSNSLEGEPINIQEVLLDQVGNEFYYKIFEQPSSISIETTKYNSPDDIFHNQNKIIEFGDRQEYDGFKQVFPAENTREVYTNLNFVNDPNTSVAGCELCGVTSYENWDKDIGMQRLGSKGFTSNSGLRNIRTQTSDIFYDTFAQTTARLTHTEIDLDSFDSDIENEWYRTGETTYNNLTVTRYETENGSMMYTYPIPENDELFESANRAEEIPVMINEPHYSLDISPNSDFIDTPSWMKDFSDFENRITGYKYDINSFGLLFLDFFPNPLPNCHIEYENNGSVYRLENGRSKHSFISIEDDQLVQDVYLEDSVSYNEKPDIEFGGKVRLIDPRDNSELIEFELQEEHNNTQLGDWLDPEYEITVTDTEVNVEISSVVVTGNFEVSLGNQTERISTEDGDYDGRGPYNPYDITFQKPSEPTDLIFRNTSVDREIVLETIE